MANFTLTKGLGVTLPWDQIIQDSMRMDQMATQKQAMEERRKLREEERVRYYAEKLQAPVAYTSYGKQMVEDNVREASKKMANLMTSYGASFYTSMEGQMQFNNIAQSISNDPAYLQDKQVAEQFQRFQKYQAENDMKDEDIQANIDWFDEYSNQEYIKGQPPKVQPYQFIKPNIVDINKVLKEEAYNVGVNQMSNSKGVAVRAASQKAIDMSTSSILGDPDNYRAFNNEYKKFNEILPGTYDNVYDYVADRLRQQKGIQMAGSGSSNSSGTDSDGNQLPNYFRTQVIDVLNKQATNNNGLAYINPPPHSEYLSGADPKSGYFPKDVYNPSITTVYGMRKGEDGTTKLVKIPLDGDVKRIAGGRIALINDMYYVESIVSVDSDQSNNGSLSDKDIFKNYFKEKKSKVGSVMDMWFREQSSQSRNGSNFNLGDAANTNSFTGTIWMPMNTDNVQPFNEAYGGQSYGNNVANQSKRSSQSLRPFRPTINNSSGELNYKQTIEEGN